MKRLEKALSEGMKRAKTAAMVWRITSSTTTKIAKKVKKSSIESRFLNMCFVKSRWRFYQQRSNQKWDRKPLQLHSVKLLMSTIRLLLLKALDTIRTLSLMSIPILVIFWKGLFLIYFHMAIRTAKRR